MTSGAIQHLLSLPASIADGFASLEDRRPPEWYADSDPPGGNLGSGGATVHLLLAAWRRLGGALSFAEWLRSSRKLIIHGGGRSRRLPAYAVVGKPLMPVPVLRWSRGQRLDQTLLDLQAPEYRRILDHATGAYAVMVTSGDVLLRFGRPLPPFPKVDVLGLGMPVAPEQASPFGVFFCPRGRPGALAFFLQKPPADRIRELARDHAFWVDTGMWLLSERAVEVLLRKTGVETVRSDGSRATPRFYELYAGFGLSLGERPAEPDPEIGGLTSAVVPLPEPEFYHLGTSRQLVESMSLLQNRYAGEEAGNVVATWRHPDQFILNSRFAPVRGRETHHTLWVENSVVPAGWELSCRHVLTNVPENDWRLRLEAGVCLDFVPVGEADFAIRAYGMEDAFRGTAGAGDTGWLERPLPEWLAARDLSLTAAGIAPETDLQGAPLFPVLPQAQIDADFLNWLVASRPPRRPECARRWLAARRLSADDLMQQANLTRLYRGRAGRRQECLEPLLRHRAEDMFFRLNLEATSKLLAESRAESTLADLPLGDVADSMLGVREEMVRAAWMRARGREGWERCEAAAFARLRGLIEHEAQLAPALPRCSVQEDQIVWGRSPARLDLAGGWTDTPPYCLENGGRVVNVAVDLNGQPPLQVFARLSETKEIVIRSIDLGTEERVDTYGALGTFDNPGSAFALAKAAFALAGFVPRFHARGGFPTLRAQLEDFGGGIEVSLLAAVPKGSGLGTSSILAATLLAVLSDLCGLGWDRHILFARTLAVEQMMTTGGGWQDQAGGIFRGIKRIETLPGLIQRPTLRWLPDHLFEPEYANHRILLYYTGLTRMAKGILQEVVRGVFLNSPEHLATLSEIGANADLAFAALQQADYEALCQSIRVSWELNQQLDRGTNPPAVRQILECLSGDLAGAKLLGAGGGGYLLLLAKDVDAASRVRRTLEERAPNPKARFVDLALSNTGLQVTRS